MGWKFRWVGNPRKTVIMHFTEVRNLPQLLGDGALFSQTLLEKGRKRFINVSNAGVQPRRKRTPVPVPPGGVVHDYVPFYFAPRSPTMNAILHAKDVAYQGGQEPLIYLVSSAQAVATAGLPFVFTDARSVMAGTKFFNDLKYLDRVDWAIQQDTYWGGDERKYKRAAELMVHERFPLALVQEIVTMNEPVKQHVERVLRQAGRDIMVRSDREWYFP